MAARPGLRLAKTMAPRATRRPPRWALPLGGAALLLLLLPAAAPEPTGAGETGRGLGGGGRAGAPCGDGAGPRLPEAEEARPGGGGSPRPPGSAPATIPGAQ